MVTSAKEEVQLLVELMKQANVTHVVLSPGSRNAPLTIAIDEDPFFTVFVITDERSAAFYALGMAQQLKKPVAIACTSGSAPLNYFPAVVEAFYQQIPLVVLTADRPTEWIDHGDGQTIRQQNAFGTHVLDFYHLVQFFNSDKKWQAQLRISELLQKAETKKGPVHINIPFTEPLYEQVETNGRYDAVLVKNPAPLKFLSDAAKSEIENLIGKSKKCMLVVGQKDKNLELDKLIIKIAEEQKVAVLVEHTSNVHAENVIEPIDSVLAVIGDDPAYKPDLVIQIGGAVISKRIKKYLRDSGAKVVSINQQFVFADVFQGLVLSLDVELLDFLHFFHKSLSRSELTSLGSLWSDAKVKMLQKHQEFSANVGFSDFKVVETVMKSVSAPSKVHFSNSSMVRYGLLFPNLFKGEVYCNRGTSGIDGCTSTAAGAAIIDSASLHILLTGDLSFFYDSNALWNAHVPENLRIIIVNNGGGDIFNIIPGPSSTNQLSKVFVAEHTYDAQKICEGFRIAYTSVSNQEALEKELPLFLDTFDQQAKVLEVHTTGIQNSAILKSYFNWIA